MADRFKHDLNGLLVVPKTELVIMHVMRGQSGQIAPWDRTKLDVIAKKVRQAKTALDDVPSHKFNSFMGQYDVFMTLKHEFAKKHDLADHQVTNAWIKMWELLGIFGGPIKPPVVAMQVAEMPGAMVLAAHHYFTQRGSNFDFYLSSWIEKSIPTIFGDKFGLFTAHIDRVVGGMKDHSGDLSQVDTIREHIAMEKFPNFFTSDLGNVDTSDYSRQEELCIWGHFGAAITALGCLREGPSLMILKMFTLYTDLGASLPLYLRRYFKEFAIVKPASSRPANSEVYLVGFGFEGIPKVELERLLGKLHVRDPAPLVPQDEAFDDLVNNLNWLAEHQIMHLDFIKQNIGNLNKITPFLESRKEEAAKYFSQYVCLPIDKTLIG